MLVCILIVHFKNLALLQNNVTLSLLTHMSKGSVSNGKIRDLPSQVCAVTHLTTAVIAVIQNIIYNNFAHI